MSRNVIRTGGIRVGTSGWSYDHWEGVLYPPGLPRNERLARYAEEFDTVEVNASFYRLPFLNMVRGWRNRTPEGFVFAVKAHRRITHYNRLRNVEEPLRTHLDRLGELGDKLGPTLFQLPPSLRRDDEVLGAFLALLPRGRYVMEFRHESWECSEVYALLDSYGVGHCVVSKPNYPVDCTATGQVGYVRLHGSRKMYASSYSEAELQEWASRVRRMKTGAETVYVYFDNDAQGHAVGDARRLKELLGV